MIKEVPKKERKKFRLQARFTEAPHHQPRRRYWLQMTSHRLPVQSSESSNKKRSNSYLCWGDLVVQFIWRMCGIDDKTSPSLQRWTQARFAVAVTVDPVAVHGVKWRHAITPSEFNLKSSRVVHLVADLGNWRVDVTPSHHLRSRRPPSLWRHWRQRAS